MTLQPGEARIRVAVVDGASTVLQAAGRDPVRVLTPRQRGPAAWVCTASFGGGLVSGDRVAVDCHIEAGATAWAGTQASTKVYRDPEGRGATQCLDARIAHGALLTWLPDPVVAFAAARYRQHQVFHCHPQGGVVWCDVLASGRPDAGEHWSARAVQSCTECWLGDQCLLRDRLELGQNAAPIDSTGQRAPWRAVATMGMVGGRCRQAAAALVADGGPAVAGCRAAISPLEDGCVVRLVAEHEAALAEWCRRALAWLVPLLGADPWQRRF